MTRHDELLAEIKKEVREMRGEIKDLGTKVTKLDTSWNGGPGTWHICQTHVEDIKGLKVAMQFVQKNIWAGMGILSLLVILAGIFGPAISQRIGVTPQPQIRSQGQGQKAPQQKTSTNTP